MRDCSLSLCAQEAEAKKLVQEAILAGVFNDLGSGSNVDITIIKRVNGKVEVVQDINSIKPNEVSELRNLIKRDIVTHIPRGATRTCVCVCFPSSRVSTLVYSRSIVCVRSDVLSSKFEPFPIVVEDAEPMEL